MVDPNDARLSYLEAWAHDLERLVAAHEHLGSPGSTAALTAKEQAKALRDQVAFCRKLMGIEHTPIDTRPTMEIRNARGTS